MFLQREKIKYNFIFVTIMCNVMIDRDLSCTISETLQSTTVIYDGSDERIDQYDAICSYGTTPFFN